MRMTIKSLGDDLFLNRLFSYLNSQLPFQIVSIKPIRKNVFIIQSDHSQFFIVKGFPSYHRLMKQVRLTAELKKNGFLQTYSFLQYEKSSPLFFDGLYLGILSYITPSKDVFTFHDRKNREEGLALLEKYHETTKNFMDSYKGILEKDKLLKKWRERTSTFINNRSLLNFFIDQEKIDEILSWANWSLTRLEAGPPFKRESSVILHGDVAHHNFLRAYNGELYLIDFDLISVGNPRVDYLQYANRILPHMNWSFEELFELKEMKVFLGENEFLYGLVFPTDILREWNRLVREREYGNPYQVRKVINYVMEQFTERQLFVQDIKKLV